MVVGGIPIGDPAGFQQWRLAAIQPGERVPNDMAPVIVMRGGKPVLAVATVGSSLVAETARILLSTLGNHLGLQAAMEAPPLLYNYLPPKGGGTAILRTQFVPESAYDPDFLRNLEASGVVLERKSRVEVLTIKGTAVVGAGDLETGAWRSVETPSLFGFAGAY
jgi:gamma-glutamyltranspeptidase